MRYTPFHYAIIGLAGYAIVTLGGASQVVMADTSFDCGRFFLKLNPKTGTKTCVNKSRSRRVSVGRIRRAQIGVQNALRQIDSFVRQDQLTQDQAQRVERIITEVRQRLDEIRNLTKQLRQDQASRDQALINGQKQRARAQKDLSRQLKQKQRDLTRQLLTQQRQLARSLRRRN